MLLENFIPNLEKLKLDNRLFNFELKSTSIEQIEVIANSLGVIIPKKIIRFYLTANGLSTVHPTFQLIDIEAWQMVDGLIHFASFTDLDGNSHNICFDSRQMNHTGQWSIINKDTGYELTKTIGSFWSNKLWKRLKFNKEIWRDAWWEK